MFRRRIQSYLLIASVGAIASGASPVFAATPETPTSITIGYVAADGSPDLKTRGEELASIIEKQIGVKVKPYAGEDYSDVIRQLIDGKVDFAFLSSLAFVEAENKAGLKVLLKKVWKQGYYYSVILTKNDSGIRKPSELKGKRIAFVDEKSASGYLYPSQFLIQMGLDLKRDFKSVVFSTSHEKSVELLRKGEVDAIAVFANDKRAQDSAWSQQKLLVNLVRVVWASAAIPNDPLCVRDKFYSQFPKLAHDVMFGLIELEKDPVAGTEFKRLLGVSSLMQATNRQYDPVREMFKQISGNGESR